MKEDKYPSPQVSPLERRIIELLYETSYTVKHIALLSSHLQVCGLQTVLKFQKVVAGMKQLLVEELAEEAKKVETSVMDLLATHENLDLACNEVSDKPSCIYLFSALKDMPSIGYGWKKQDRSLRSTLTRRQQNLSSSNLSHLIWRNVEIQCGPSA
jgi:hypothetical protein